VAERAGGAERACLYDVPSEPRVASPEGYSRPDPRQKLEGPPLGGPIPDIQSQEDSVKG